MRTLATTVLATLLLCAASTRAEDLGIKGPNYRPDPDAREQFKDVVRGKQQSGELDAYWKSYRDKTVASIKNPAPLGVRTDYAPRTELKPVRFVIPANYRDQNGKVVVSRGTVVEPLKIQPLTKGLIFIDGRDPTQVDYAIARGRQQPLKIVLTAGSPYELRVKYEHAAWRDGVGIPFYFDQRRMLLDSLKRLYGINVASVPAVMTQSGTGVRLEFGMRGHS
jgi:conjugal transfer pilus assembly protein TraW